MAESLEIPRPVVPTPVGAMQSKRTARKLRYEIWSVQARNGRDPCFGTSRRFLCDELDCSWREECLRLRAEWMA